MAYIVAIYEHGDENLAKLKEMEVRGKTGFQVVHRAARFYEGEVESFDEVLITPGVQRFLPDMVRWITSRYGEKGKLVRLMEAADGTRVIPISHAPALAPTELPQSADGAAVPAPKPDDASPPKPDAPASAALVTTLSPPEAGGISPLGEAKSPVPANAGGPKEAAPPPKLAK